MNQKLKVFLLLLFSPTLVIALSSNQDLIGLNSLDWKYKPPNWEGSDPCGDNNWDGIGCTTSRVTSIRLASMGLSGQLSGDISHLTELQTLDLSYNKELTGPLPESIGNLKKLIYLILAGCNFNGHIPSTIGSLGALAVLSLNSNNFSGLIPPSIGRLSNLAWLDLTDNNIEGPIPVSHGGTPGLDMLLYCRHFHLGKNKLRGPIPNKLFNSNMTLIHVLFDNNKLSGRIPSTIGLVQTLLVVDMSNNSFEESDFPSWYSTLHSLNTLALGHTNLQGKIPFDLFSLPELETVILEDNKLNGTLEFGNSVNENLRLIDLRSNFIDYVDQNSEVDHVQIILAGNPECTELNPPVKYCNDSISQSSSSYVTDEKNCYNERCNSDQELSPNCICAHPYIGILTFITPFFSNLENTTHYKILEMSLMKFFQSNRLLVDSVSLSNPRKDPFGYLDMTLKLFPYGRDHFSHSEISNIGFALSNQTYKPPEYFGPYLFMTSVYQYCEGPEESKKSNIGIIIGAAAGSSALVLLLLLAGVYTMCHKRRAERANKQAHWDTKKSNKSTPELKGARWFSFEELKRYTNNFSAANDIGSGGYGKVYRGTLPTGELIAIKRAKRESMQGEVEFKTEIELLSRVHHKNLVSLLGFCFEKGEQVLIYEYVPNGNLKDTLSGKSGIRLDWRKRLRVALDTARGLAYLHEHVNPPIIHRDIKSTNVLLDVCLNAKVADFGLSKPMGDTEKDHVSTQVKGTMGYLDPEYYMTQQVTEKSDVYSFGVLMLELITARKPIQEGKYIARVVQTTMDKTKYLYNLQAVVDPTMDLEATLNGFERFVDLAMRCLEDSRTDRPTMSEVVKEIETIIQSAGLHREANSTSISVGFEDSNNVASSSYSYNEE